MSPEEFRNIRIRLGLTQARLADLLGYAHAMSISGFERPRNRRPVPAQLAWLMEALDAGFWPKGWPPHDSAADTRTGGRRTRDQ